MVFPHALRVDNFSPRQRQRFHTGQGSLARRTGLRTGSRAGLFSIAPIQPREPGTTTEHTWPIMPIEVEGPRRRQAS